MGDDEASDPALHAPFCKDQLLGDEAYLEELLAVSSASAALLTTHALAGFKAQLGEASQNF